MPLLQKADSSYLSYTFNHANIGNLIYSLTKCVTAAYPKYSLTAFLKIVKSLRLQ